MKKILIALLAACSGGAAGAQSTPESVHLRGLPQCGFREVLERLQTPYSALLASYRAGAPAAKGAGVVYDIPVVFHVVYASTNTAFNIPDSVISDQVSVLNKAFRRQHADTANVRSFFKPLSGDAEIQFHLATTDPQGNPTNGITRTLSTRRYFGATSPTLDSLERLKRTATGGIDPWPTDRYLNIWVGNLSDSAGNLSVLGYGIPPLNPIPPNWPAGSAQGLSDLTDGVVLQVHTVGSNSGLSAALQGIYTKGRAAVHEVGHYLGLQHVFGGNGGGASSCGQLADDGIGDTPTQSTQSFDQNSGTSCPRSAKNSCGAGTAGDLPDMWENYMDYSRDACQTLFTHDQIAVMRAVMGNQRQLLTGALAVPAQQTQTVTGLYPNPARGKISVLYPGAVREAVIRNLLGQELARFRGAAAGEKTYDISSLPEGNYILVLETAAGPAAAKFSVLR